MPAPTRTCVPLPVPTPGVVPSPSAHAGARAIPSERSSASHLASLGGQAPYISWSMLARCKAVIERDNVCDKDFCYQILHMC